MTFYSFMPTAANYAELFLAERENNLVSESARSETLFFLGHFHTLCDPEVANQLSGSTATAAWLAKYKVYAKEWCDPSYPPISSQYGDHTQVFVNCPRFSYLVQDTQLCFCAAKR